MTDAVALAMGSADEVYVKASQDGSPDLWRSACVARAIGVPGFLVRLVIFDSPAGLETYLARDSFPALSDSSSIVASGDLPKLKPTFLPSVDRVPGAKMYCLEPSSCSAWILTQVFPDCQNVVVDATFATGNDTKQQQAADAMLPASQTLLEWLKSIGFCTPSLPPFPEYQGLD